LSRLQKLGRSMPGRSSNVSCSVSMSMVSISSPAAKKAASAALNEVAAGGIATWRGGASNSGAETERARMIMPAASVALGTKSGRSGSISSISSMSSSSSI
jgi:hypothetical protein